jgi:hypothetical protein
MAVSLIKLTRTEYYSFNNLALFDDNLNSRCYGVITDGQNDFRLAWQSDLIEPILTQVEANVFSIGIDQDFAVVDFSKNIVLFRLRLIYNFIFTQLFKASIFVITELEIIKIDTANYKISNEYALPESFEDIITLKDSLKILCAEGKYIEIA